MEEGTLPLIKANNTNWKRGRSLKSSTFLHANQAYLFLITGADAGFGALPLAIVRQSRGCSEMCGVPVLVLMCGCWLDTKYGPSATLTQRPAFSRSMYGITAFELHRAHLPCSLSLSTRKQSRHSNASGGCSIGLINGWAISTSFRVGETTGKLSVFQRISIYFWGLGVLCVEQAQTLNGLTTLANC